MAALDNPFYFSVKEDDKRKGIVFGGGDSVRYYNVKSPGAATSPSCSQVQAGPSGYQARRRTQSTGQNRQAPSCSRCTNHDFLSESSNDTTPSVYRTSLLNKISNTLHTTQGLRSEMLDIAIFSCKQSEAASLWVKYLTSCFLQISKEEKRPPFKLACVSVEDVLGGVRVEGREGSRLQIVVLCPLMLQTVGSSPGAPLLASMFQPATALAMLLGVTNSSLDSHHLSGMFHFEQWRRLTVKDQDPTFVGDFMGVSMDILSRSWQLEHAITQMHSDNNNAHFSIIPKKIKVGQNKLIILLTTPISANDKINITVDKNGQKIEVQSFKRRNPYTLQFAMPAVCLQTSMLVSVNIERNGRSLGQRLVKCESRLRELDQLLKSVDNPIHFMCQALGFNSGDREHLDNFLVGALQRNIPPNFHLLNSPTSASLPSNEEFPTLLHFGARYGLEKLCWQLLDCPGGEQACQLRNANHQTPVDLAEKAGYTRLSHTLRGYLQMTELSSMYHYIKGISDKPQAGESNSNSSSVVGVGGGDIENNYLLPRPLSDTYLVPPSGVRPVLLPLGCLESAYQVPPSPSPSDHYQSPPHARPFTPITPSTPSSPLDHRDFATYLHMHSPVADPLNFRLDMDFCHGRYKNIDAQSQGSDQFSMSNGNHVSTSCNSSMSGKMSPQDELVEIINDFKNNVFTITEVEKLVEAWRNRNDVQQSFREKQEQLNYMRQEYERIQQTMKDQMKRATPFDKIKKFFSRKSKSTDNTAKGRTGEAVCHRPCSSLSLHSSCSSSSGRMSTGSGTSLGDSGTHSDHDDKKSEDFVYHDKLQSVKESEHSGSSLPDESSPSNEGECEAELPQPPGVQGKTVAIVHRSLEEEETSLPPDKEEETTENNAKEKNPKTDVNDNDYVESTEMVILEQSERLLKDMADTLIRSNDKDLNENLVLCPKGQDDLVLKALEENMNLTDAPDYVNVSPLPPPPIPPRAKYKNVIL